MEEKNQDQEFLEYDSDDDKVDNYEYINDPQQFLEWCQKDKKIKVISQIVPYNKQLQLFDISLFKGGNLEDKKYASNGQYRINIRRGNTICKISDENQENHKYIFIRRGVVKFYDMQYEYFNQNIKINKYHQRVKNLIYDPISEYLSQNKSENYITFYKLFKENGEHCQISYHIDSDSWLIASKNVTLLLRNEEDLEKYTQDRCFWAKIIAKEWFKIYNNLENESLKQEIKQQMHGKTFIGEYCGYKEKQHITIYENTEIIFYSITENNYKGLCLPVEKAFQIFDQFGLKKVKMEKFDNISSIEEFNNIISNIMEKTCSGDMLIEGEGAVVYVVGKQQQNEENQETLQLFKLKTTEYFIYRKLREMLKQNFTKKINNKSYKFQFEIEQLSKYYQPPQPLQYYYKIADKAFQIVDSEVQNWETLRYKFVDFIENIKKTIQEEKQDKNLNNQQLQEQQQNEQNIKKTIYILITPPTYLSDNTIQQIIEDLKIEEFKTLIRKEDLQTPVSKNTLALLHMIPQVDIKNLEQNQIQFIIIGFTNTGLKCSLNNLENNKEQILQNSQYSGKNQQVFQYFQSKNQQQQLEFFFKKTEWFIKELQENQNNNTIILQEYERQSILDKFEIKIKEKNQDKNIENIENELSCKNEKQKNKISLLVITSFVIPGAGKSHLSTTLKELVKNKNLGNFTVFTEISSDKLRKKLMQDEKKLNKDLTKQQLFELTSQQISQSFQQYFQTFLQNIDKSLQKQPQKQVIFYIDRNNIPKKMTQLQELLLYNLQNCQFLNQQNTKMLTLIPNNSFQNSLTISQTEIYPFGSQFILHCIERILNKRFEGSHETMDTGDDLTSIKIVFKFCRDFKNFKYQKLFQIQEIQNDIVEYPFTDDSIETGTLEKFICNVFKKIKKNKVNPVKRDNFQTSSINNDINFDDNSITELLTEFYKLGFSVQEKQLKQQQQSLLIKYFTQLNEQ